MLKTIGWKIVLILAVIVGSIVMLYPPGEKINLGLDLKGGMHLVFRVETAEGIKTLTDNDVLRLKKELNELSIKCDNILRQASNKIDIIGTTYEDENKIKELLDDQFRDWDYVITSSGVTLSLRPNIEMQMAEQTVNQALETIRNRVDEFGVAEPVFQRESSDRLLIELPGVSDKEKMRVMSLIKSTAMLEFKKVIAGPFPSEEEALKQYNGVLPQDLSLVKWSSKARIKDANVSVSVLESTSVFTGRDLKIAKLSQDQWGGAAVAFSLNASGAARFRTFTAANIGQKLAIVLDNRIISDPTIQDVLSFDSIITGGFSVEEAEDLALKLRSGALPAPLTMMHEQVIGPSLGADSIRKGLIACTAALLLVIAFMLVYYKGAGVNSVLALILNMIITLGVLAMFRATLTLPGIAGFILTIGMAVDANVLIFERIKEELNLGKSPKSAIDAGFKKAFWTIFDSNLTTVIAAVFLFQFGTSSIKGFAVTLIIGIAASMFTAIFVSRVIFELTYAQKKKLTKISI
jgi:preprotein translocase subunit SecD